jgi:hypothetical protein
MRYLAKPQEYQSQPSGSPMITELTGEVIVGLVSPNTLPKIAIGRTIIPTFILFGNRHRNNSRTEVSGD